MKASPNILLIDHDDSFTFNLRHWLFPISHSVHIVNHQDLSKIQNLEKYELIVLSPGPKHPADYPHVIKWLNQLPANQPVFGVCLGMQLMTITENGEVQPHAIPRHGKISELEILDSVLTDFTNQKVARYHSLQCFTSDAFIVMAKSKRDHVPMWIEHKNKKWLGFQFHPESFLTERSEKYQSYLQHWMDR